MQKKLPARPNLEHLRGQAKSLLSAVKAGESEAMLAVSELHPGFVVEAITLADAQLVVARKHDFASWPKLVHYIDELASLEGTWSFASLEIDGNKMAQTSFARSHLVIDGDRFRMVSPEATYEGIMDVDVEVEPHTLDIDFTEGPEAGNSSYAIYHLHGDELTICLGFTGVPRPTKFETQKGSGHALETLRRSQPVEGVTATDAKPAGESVPACRADYEVVTSEHLRLQGEWTALEITKDGMELPPYFAKEGRRFGEGALATVKFGPQIFMQALTRIDLTQSPVQIDYLNIYGPTEGQVQLGILRWVDEDVQICFGEPGSPRPVDFESGPGSGHTLSTWRRKT